MDVWSLQQDTNSVFIIIYIDASTLNFANLLAWLREVSGPAFFPSPLNNQGHFAEYKKYQPHLPSVSLQKAVTNSDRSKNKRKPKIERSTQNSQGDRNTISTKIHSSANKEISQPSASHRQGYDVWEYENTMLKTTVLSRLLIPIVIDQIFFCFLFKPFVKKHVFWFNINILFSFSSLGTIGIESMTYSGSN